MKKFIIIICLLILTVQGYSQKNSLALGCNTDKQGRVVVQLKFLFPDKIISDFNVNVFRKSQNGNWEKLNSAAITKASLTENINDEGYSFYKGYMSRKKAANPEDENNSQALAGLMLVDNNNFAKYAGCYYEDITAVTGSTYQYRITDAGAGDKELAVSAFITVKAAYLPVVANVTVKQKKQDINLNWNKNKIFYAYNIYRRTGDNGKLEKITQEGIMLARLKGEAENADEPKYTDSSAAAGTTLYYDVRGIDVLGNESPSGTIVKVEVKDMLPPSAIKTLKATRENHNAVITWGLPASKDVKGYNIYRNSTSDTNYNKITETLLPAAAISFTDKKLKEGAVYGYIVESVDEAGNATKSRPTKVFFPDQTPPAKPSGLKAVSKPGTIFITWNKNTEADMKGYFIYRSSSRNKEYFNMLNRYPITTNSFNDTLPGIAKNEFVYYVQAVDKSYNTSIPSDTIIVTLPDTAAPQMPIIRNISYDKGDVQFDVDLRDEDGYSYDVYRTEDSVNNKNYIKLTTSPSTSKSYTDHVGSKEKSYHYYIISHDKAGNSSSASQKRSVYADADSITNVAVQNINAKYSSADSSISLSWNSVANAAGYIVYRKDDGGQFIPISGSQKTTTYIDKYVEAGISYQYRVRTMYTETTETTMSPEITVSAK